MRFTVYCDFCPVSYLGSFSKAQIQKNFRLVETATFSNSVQLVKQNNDCLGSSESSSANVQPVLHGAFGIEAMLDHIVETVVPVLMKPIQRKCDEVGKLDQA